MSDQLCIHFLPDSDVVANRDCLKVGHTNNYPYVQLIFLTQQFKSVKDSAHL